MIVMIAPPHWVIKRGGGFAASRAVEQKFYADSALEANLAALQRAVARGSARQGRDFVAPVIFSGKYFVYTREALGESGNWQPCLKNYLRFVLDCCSPSRFLPRPWS
ncbi:MAG TPA: hypothetical protein VFB32_00870 [Rudaea sp.]|nr:hypothetical protein [Rudaea sp.]